MADAHLIDDLGRLRALRDEWDALAVAASAPYAAPGWLLPWWEHVAPKRARLNVVTVRDDDNRLIGLGPWYRQPTRTVGDALRPLGTTVCDRVGPLAAPGQERAVASELARVLRDLGEPLSVLSLEALPGDSPWPAALEATGRTRVVRWRTSPSLSLRLAGRGFDDWFMSKSKHFRQRMRKLARDFEAAGGVYRRADATSLEADLASFARLHRARWEERGGSNALHDGVDEMLIAAGRELTASGRMRVWSLDLDGTTVSSHVLLCAGEEIGYWLTGFDEQRGPGTSMLGILHSVEDAFSTDAARLDLGHGTMAYKRRFADTEETLVSDWVLPRGPRGRLTQAMLTPQRARLAVARRLPVTVKLRLRKLRRTLPARPQA